MINFCQSINSTPLPSFPRTNIQLPSLDINSGSEVMPYLQPLPPRGTGFHRFVFSLFTHPRPLDITEKKLGLVVADGEKGTWLDQRTFSTKSFLSRHQAEPFTFALFQSQWDSSVQHVFSDVLGKFMNIVVISRSCEGGSLLCM